MTHHRLALVNDSNVQVCHESQYSLAAVRSPDADVVQFRAVAQRDGAGAVDNVAANLGVGENRLSRYLRCPYRGSSGPSGEDRPAHRTTVESSNPKSDLPT